MNKKEIKVGDLCLHGYIPVIVLEKRIYMYSSGSSKKGRYSYFCLIYNNKNYISESSLRKL